MAITPSIVVRSTGTVLLVCEGTIAIEMPLRRASEHPSGNFCISICGRVASYAHDHHGRAREVPVSSTWRRGTRPYCSQAGARWRPDPRPATHECTGLLFEEDAAGGA